MCEMIDAECVIRNETYCVLSVCCVWVLREWALCLCFTVSVWRVCRFWTPRVDVRRIDNEAISRVCAGAGAGRDNGEWNTVHTVAPVLQVLQMLRQRLLS